MSDSLLVFVPLLLDLTGDICVRFWSCMPKNCSKESIPSLSKETSLSYFGQTGVCKFIFNEMQVYFLTAE